jgi:hypothetical protein
MNLRHHLTRFIHGEQGQMMVEFILLVPLIFTIFLTSVEMGIYSMRQMFLDRGLDMTVRTIRLTTGEMPQHAELKTMICDNAGFLQDCDNTLRLEMQPADPRGFVALPETADCVDLSEPVEPLRSFVPGGDHELMILRACVKFDPVFPTTGLGYAFSKDGTGRAQMISMSAFVQEPGT